MEKHSENNTCPKCGQNFLNVIEDDVSKRGACQSCGYTFSDLKQQQPLLREPPIPPSTGGGIMDIFDTLNRFSAIMAIIAIVMAVLILVAVGGQVGGIDGRVTSINDSLSSEISTLEGDINGYDGRITSNENDVDTLITDIESLSDLPTDISTLQSDLDLAEDNISSLDATLTNLSNTVDNIDTSNIVDAFSKIKFLFYVSQSNTTSSRYCHIEFFVDKNEIKLQEVKFGFRYPFTNVTLLDWTGCIKPQEYQWTNGSCNDNYCLNWFEKTDGVSAKFNVTWDIADYNNTQLSLDNFSEVVKVNSVFLTSARETEII